MRPARGPAVCVTRSHDRLINVVLPGREGRSVEPSGPARWSEGGPRDRLGGPEREGPGPDRDRASGRAAATRPGSVAWPAAARMIEVSTMASTVTADRCVEAIARVHASACFGSNPWWTECRAFSNAKSVSSRTRHRTRVRREKRRRSSPASRRTTAAIHGVKPGSRRPEDPRGRRRRPAGGVEASGAGDAGAAVGVVGAPGWARAGPAAASTTTTASSTPMSAIVRLADMAGRVTNERPTVNCGSRSLPVDSLTGPESLWDHNVPP